MSEASVNAPAVPPLEVVPIGGLGEFGMNMMLVASGDDAVLIDAGVMFPEPDLLGVDLVIPDLSVLDEWRGRIRGLVLTHGHEDHIGAVAHVLPRVDGPIYASPFTLALVGPKLEQYGIDARDRMIEVRPKQTIDVGSMRLEFLRVTHSIPDCLAVAIHTPAGIIVHTGDFKIDQTPLDGEPTDLHRLAELGAQGVLALLADSTNCDRRGYTGSERDVIPGFEEIFCSTQGKIVVASFATSIYRMQILVDLAAQFDRRVAFVGRGAIHNSEIAMRLGRLRMPSGVQIRDVDVRDFPSQDVLCICTGSQGEPRAALPRIAIDDHRHVKLGEGDVVVFSARAIPGNEKAIGRVMNHLARRGATVIADGEKHIHVSGHASAEELKLVISLVKPRHFIPVHGEYRQLSRHARMAKEVDDAIKVVLAEDGDVIRFEAEVSAGGQRGAVTGRIDRRLAAGRTFIDGSHTGEVGDEVLRERRHLAEDGVVVAVLAINGHSGVLEEPPQLVTRGLVVDQKTEAALKDVPALLLGMLEQAPREERTDPGLMNERVRTELQRFFRKRTGKRPFVLPVVMEV
ncbi:MAG: ribonuclease J [Acidobacteriota bacterium]|nr:ribonuclease J [Acidobacteriota bacterium]